MLAQQRSRGQGLQGGDVAGAGQHHVGVAVVVAGPLPDPDAARAVPDRLLHRQVLERRLLAEDLNPGLLWDAKRLGFSDVQIAQLAEGEADKAGKGPVFSAIVLVDVTPRVNREGVAKIQGFMRERAGEGFATIAEAADSVAAYLPHRPRPRSHEGLKKNLRLHPDGRWRWHWDPAVLKGERSFAIDHHILERALIEAAKTITIPALLVRGGSSELVQEAHVREFLDLVPHADYIDVAEARHMVAGDANDSFSDAVLDFVAKQEGTQRRHS